jgi:hypothetical protein
MSAVLIALVLLSSLGLLSVPLVRLWFATAEQIREADRAPALAPH